MSDEFRGQLIAHAKKAVSVSESCVNEEATKLSLVLPFLQLLGFNPLDPAEVCPEHAADFAEKNKNRVDFAIMFGGEPQIAVECKKAGSVLKDAHGQLKGYFNAVQSIKLAVLTDGIMYEFYADSDVRII